MRILIKGGRVIDPGHIDGIRDIRIENGVIREIAPDIVPDNDEQVISASHRIVAPGLIDMHVHFREPGHEYKETIESGCRAAAAGGFTAVCPMPNTDPVNDCAPVTAFIREKAAQANGVRVHPVGAISRRLEGQALCEYGEMKGAGAVAFSDDGMPVKDPLMMRRALEYAAGFGLPIISHCEERSLSRDGAMNEGAMSTALGLAGIPNAAESIMVMRDIALAELTGAPLHIAHVSARESVRAIRQAKELGIPVTAETAPHYFTLTEAAVADYNTHAKMNPPLRTEQDRDAVRQGLADGTLDVIATDHAPHADLEKELEFALAANGIIGLETSLSLGLRLVADGVLSLSSLIEKMSTAPARILGLSSGLAVGATADITVIDPDCRYRVEPARFYSKSKNTPFAGWTLQGKAVLTVAAGQIVYEQA